MNGAFPPLRFPPFSVTDALTDTAVGHYAPAFLERGGPAGRARRLVERGLDLEAAAADAAKQGKGHLAELLQSVRFEIDAAMRGSHFDSRPNPMPNDPSADLEVLSGGRRVRGPQVKVGAPAYIRRSQRKRQYRDLIVNAEAYDDVADLHRAGVQLADRLSHDGAEARQLLGSDVQQRATGALTRVLQGRGAIEVLDLLLSSVRAGVTDGIIVFGTDVAWGLVRTALFREEVDLHALLGGAARRSLRAAARTTLQTDLLLTEFLERAAEVFEYRLLRRVGGSTLAVGALAEVIVETVIDVVAVVRGELEPDQLLPRLGFHALQAAGGAGGAFLALRLTRGMPFWIVLPAVLALGYVGTMAGRGAGQLIFQPASIRGAD